MRFIGCLAGIILLLVLLPNYVAASCAGRVGCYPYDWVTRTCDTGAGKSFTGCGGTTQQACEITYPQEERCNDVSGSHSDCYDSDNCNWVDGGGPTPTPTPAPAPGTCWCGNLDNGTCAIRTIAECEANYDHCDCTGGGGPTPIPTPTPTPAYGRLEGLVRHQRTDGSLNNVRCDGTMYAPQPTIHWRRISNGATGTISYGCGGYANDTFYMGQYEFTVQGMGGGAAVDGGRLASVATNANVSCGSLNNATRQGVCFKWIGGVGILRCPPIRI